MSDGYWLYNRETGEPWNSSDPPHLIDYVPRGQVEQYRIRKLSDRLERAVKTIEDAARKVATL